MQSMISFSMAILDALVDFLGSEPIFYIVGLTCFLFVVKAVKILISN